MRYRQCRSCSFWVTRGERFCTNCGVYRPFQSGRGQRSAWLVFTTMLGGVLGGSVFYRPDSSLLLYGCIAGCATGLAWGLGLFAEVSAILQGRRRSPSLQASELRLAGRLAEILQTKRQVRDLLGRLRAERGSTVAGGQLLTDPAQGGERGQPGCAPLYRGAGEAGTDSLAQRAGAAAGAAADADGGSVCEPTQTPGRDPPPPAAAATNCSPRGAAPAWTNRSSAGHTVQQLQRWLDACDRIIERTIAEQAHATLEQHRRRRSWSRAPTPR